MAGISQADICKPATKDLQYKNVIKIQQSMVDE
jgi:hypothetical protein